MSLFTSNRERRLWLWALAVLVAIFATIGVSNTLAGLLIERRLLDSTFFFAFLILMAAIAALALQARPRGIEIAILVGVAAVYAMVVFRMVSPVERSHVVEYGMLVVLIYEALKERRRNGLHVPVPAVLAFVAAAILGFADEAVQAVVPSRVYDIQDVVVNVNAALLTLLASVVLAKGRQLGENWRNRRRNKRHPREN